MKKILILLIIFSMIFSVAYAEEFQEFNKKEFLEELSKEQELTFEEVYLLQHNGYKLSVKNLEKYKKQARTESFPTGKSYKCTGLRGL